MKAKDKVEDHTEEMRKEGKNKWEIEMREKKSHMKKYKWPINIWGGATSLAMKQV